MFYVRLVSLLSLLFVAAGCVNSGSQSATAEMSSSDVERGRYLVQIMGCNDCHTPGYMSRATQIPEESWLVGGSLGFHGSWGTAYPTNLRLMLESMSEDEWLLLARKMRRDSPMAWAPLPKVAEQELRALYRFVRYLGPKGEPAPKRLPAGVTPPTKYLNFPDPH
jgi:mono/diheme cytochrome c family protein